MSKITEEYIKRILAENGYSIMAQHLHKDEQLICDPIIWQKDDLKLANANSQNPGDFDTVVENWEGSRAYRTLSERSIEEGWQIIDILLSEAE